MAAIQARRLGRRVALVTPGGRLGGMTISGLSLTDSGTRTAIGGIAREFYRRVRENYVRNYGLDSPQVRDCQDGFRFEPKVAEKVIGEMVQEAGVTVFRNQPLKAVTQDSRRITEMTALNGTRYRAKIYLDATYEGDLMAKAGVTYTVGREGNAKYNETLNGVQLDPPFHNFLLPVDPFQAEGFPSSGLVKGVSAESPGKQGQGDRKVQAYCYRMCLTNVAENRLPFPKPRFYDVGRYTLLLRYLKQGGWEGLDDGGRLPNGKIDCNNKGAFSTDNIGMSWDYPEGDTATRRRIVLDHLNYQQGLMYFLSTDERVPENVRAEVSQWGPARDEFTQTGNWPHDLYIREARRLVSDYVMTEHNCRGVVAVEDSVGLASYPMDSHNVQRVVREGTAREGSARDSVVQNEGDVQAGGFQPYPIAYRAMAPADGECENLLVPVCVSASHIAFGSIRMEPVFMILGQSAATAAHLALQEGVPVQGVNVRKLQVRLREDGQILNWQGGMVAATGSRTTPQLPPPPDPRTLKGVLLDDPASGKTGNWILAARPAESRLGGTYIHDGNADKGSLSAVYTPDLPEDGNYTVILVFPPGPERAANVPVTLSVEGVGSTTFRVNQRVAENNGFAALGTFKLPKGKRTTVTVSNRGTDGYVAVDGLQLVPVRETPTGG